MKIRVYVNGEYQFTTTRYRNTKELRSHIRAVKHIQVAGIPNPIYLTVYDYDKLKFEIV